MRILLTVCFMGYYLLSGSIYAQLKPAEPIPQFSVSFVRTINPDSMNFPSKYLFVMPGNPVRNPINGDFAISDECYIKIYNSDWKPKKLLGGKGQGPGEYSSEVFLLFFSPSRYLSAIESSGIVTILTVYDSVYNLLYKKNVTLSKQGEEFIKNNGLLMGPTYTFATVSPDEFFHHIGLRDEDNNNYRLFAFERNNTFIPIKLIKLNDKIGTYSTSVLHTVVVNCINENTVLYYDSDEDKFYSDDKGDMTVHIISIKNNTDEKIVLPFKPTKIPEESFESIKTRIKDEKLRNEILDAYRKKKYVCALFFCKVDNRYAYIGIDNKNRKLFIDTIYEVDLQAKKVTGVFPSVFPTLIFNGLIYTFETSKEGFEVVRIYKINRPGKE